MNIKPRTKDELNLMRISGEITAKALKKALEAVKPGVTLKELDRIAEEEILSHGAKSSFKSVPGYKWTSCVTINQEVVHGIPRDLQVFEGDLVSIDLGALYKGWHTDAAWSVVVGGGKSKFLDTGEEAMWSGIKNAVTGKKVGDISNAIQQTIEKGGYKVVRSLVGHGVGRELHEEPEIPGYGRAGVGFKLIKDMTIAIEAIYTEGTSDVVLDPDGWTITSADGSMGGLFEMSVIVSDGKAEVLTDWRKV